MAVSLDYVSRETARNIWRNRLMTVAAVMTVAISLSLVGAALLLKQGASNAEALWQRETEVTVWMQPSATHAEITAVHQRIHAMPYVTGCVYRNKSYDYAQAKTLLQPDVISVLGKNQIPTAFECTPLHPADAFTVISQLSKQPGVLNVSAPQQQIHTMERTITVLQWVFLSVAVVLLLSAAVLILNSIRMAIYARRREVSVMKLVGATNAFIRIPFMSEGLLQGLMGSIVAAAIVYGLHLLLDSIGGQGSVLQQMRLTSWEVIGTNVVVVAVGVVIGSAGSAIAIRRFLDV